MLGPKANLQARVIDLLRRCKVQAELNQEAADEEGDDDPPPIRLAGD
jgi:hypothetical protein